MSILFACAICSCKEFVANPWREEKCMNCYHLHAPTSVEKPPQKTLYPKATIRNLKPNPSSSPSIPPKESNNSNKTVSNER